MGEPAMRCDLCQHWQQDAEGYRAVRVLGQCRKAVELWDATEWVEDPDPDAWPDGVMRLAKDDGQMSFVQDGSDYQALLWTKPEFFCAHFETKP